MLDILLFFVTLIIGWIVWSVIVWGRGQSPAKQLMSMRVVRMREGDSGTWGKMFVREIIAKSVIGVLSWLTLGIINFWLIWDKNNQQLWDKVVDTVVVDDPNDQVGMRSQTKQAATPAAVQFPAAAALPGVSDEQLDGASLGEEPERVASAASSSAESSTGDAETAAADAPAPPPVGDPNSPSGPPPSAS